MRDALGWPQPCYGRWGAAGRFTGGRARWELMEFRRQLVVGHTALLLVTLITAAVAAIALRISSAHLESVSRDLVDEFLKSL
jgi:hypothetical protein